MSHETCRIATVLGPVTPESLGITMMHEHLTLALSATQTVDDMDGLQVELADLAAYGCRTVVELSNIGMGRDPARLAALAQATGMNIIAGTGFYTQAWHPRRVAEQSIDELAAIMVRELRDGIDGGGVRAGVIGEIGTSQHAITPDEEKVVRAAARAHLQTGRPISTHTSLGTLPLEQLDILQSEGVDLRYVVIGHLDLADAFETVLAVAERGAFVQLDTFGKRAYRSDETRMTYLLKLVEAGYCASVLVSCDLSRNNYMKAYGGHGYDYFLREVVPALRGRGLDDAALNAILIDNPRRVLEGKCDA